MEELKTVTGTEAQNMQVRERLLDAAERLFCEKGFDRTSVRDLTTAADCNIAAVNYHFGGKDKLYIQMFHRQMHRMMDRHREVIVRLTGTPGTTIEDLLRGIVSQPLKQLERNDPSSAVMKLMVREVLNQHIGKDEILGDMKNEFFTLLGDALRSFCPGLNVRNTQLLFLSLDALVIHAVLFSDFYLEMVPDLDIDGIIEHIVKVAAAGIGAYAQGGD
jgi:AcrR family transcriptional regulator